MKPLNPKLILCSPTYSLWAICNTPGWLFWPTARTLPLVFLMAPHNSAQSYMCLLTQLAIRSLFLPRSLFSVKMMFSIFCLSFYLRVPLYYCVWNQFCIPKNICLPFLLHIQDLVGYLLIVYFFYWWICSWKEIKMQTSACDCNIMTLSVTFFWFPSLLFLHMSNEAETYSHSQLITFGESQESLYALFYLFIFSAADKNIEMNKRLFHSASPFSLMQTERF